MELGVRGQLLQILAQFFSSGFMPHGFCYLWDPQIVWLHVISDSLIGLSYYCIPFGLIYFLRKRPDVNLHWILWLFAIFVLGCGTTHLMEVWTVWHGNYLLSGVIKALTAGASVITAVALVPLVPKAVALPSYSQLEQMNQELQEQIAERENAENRVRELNDRLEQRVAERTGELEEIRHALQESRARLAGIIASAMDAIITVDEEQRIVLFNTAAEEMFHCPAAEAIGQPVERFIPQRFREKHREHVRRFGESGVNARNACPLAERTGLRGDGQEFPIEASISQTAAGGRKLFTVIIRDVTEKQRAEASRLHLAAIVESTDSAVLSKDLNGIVTSWNKGAELLYGYTEAEIVGQHVNLIVPQELHREEEEILRQIADGVLVRQAEALRQHKDGRLIYVSLIISPVRDSSGKIAGASTIAHDITERKWAEEALRESEERFQAMANGIPQLAWMAEADGSIFWYNQRWYDYTGTTFEQMQGWGWRSVHYPELLPTVMDRWKASIAQGQPFDMEFPLRGRDGSFRTFLTRVQPVSDAEGRVIRWFGTNTDISDHKAVEERLALQAEELSRQAEELRNSRVALESQTLMLQSMLDNMEEGLVAADDQGRFLLWNSAAERILGNKTPNLPTHEWSKVYGLYLPDGVTHYPAESLPLVKALHGEVGKAEIQVLRSGCPEPRWIEVSARPLRDARAQICGGIATFRDITAQRAAEHEIRKLNDDLERRVLQRTAELEAANQELESFTYSVSHDLRAPLRHIGGFSKLLVEEFGPRLEPEAQHYLQRIGQGTKKMGQLVDELLNLARVGRQALSLQPASLTPIVQEALEELKPETEGRHIEWKIGSLPYVDCDPLLIKQVFQNLIANALKYSRPRSCAVIEIGTIRNNGDLAVFVRDNGVGFSMKYADKLFGVFQRLHRDEDFEGTGVGLATVKRIVQKHGGRVWAEGELDHGATFYFTVLGAEQAVNTPEIEQVGAQA